MLDIIRDVISHHKLNTGWLLNQAQRSASPRSCCHNGCSVIRLAQPQASSRSPLQTIPQATSMPQEPSAQTLPQGQLCCMVWGVP